MMADRLGIQAAQARLWGAASGQTGVTTPIGAPKLELLADHIARRAYENGIPLSHIAKGVAGGWWARSCPTPLNAENKPIVPTLDGHSRGGLPWAHSY
jgi:hypothetical protein